MRKFIKPLIIMSSSFSLYTAACIMEVNLPANDNNIVEVANIVETIDTPYALEDTSTIKYATSSTTSSTSSTSENTFWDNVLQFLGTPAVITVIASICLTALFRAIIKVYNMGVAHKSDFATKQDMENYKNQINQRLNESESRIKDDVMRVCLVEINQQAQRINTVQEMAGKIESDKRVIDVKISALDQKFAEITSISSEIRSLSEKVNSVTYGQANVDSTRRQGHI
jgi:hypothetical protein